jgi:hypothetical protein
VEKCFFRGVGGLVGVEVDDVVIESVVCEDEGAVGIR